MAIYFEFSTMEYGKGRLLAEQAKQASSYIGETLRTYLPEVILEGKTVYSLGTGGGEELLHLRDLVGMKTPIIAVELNPYKSTIISSIVSYSRLVIDDIRNFRRIIDEFGTPGLLVSRAPRIAEGINKYDGSLISVNNWWLCTIPDWVCELPEKSGAFISTFSLKEADLMEEALEVRGIKIARFEPENMPPQELTLGSGMHRFGPERAILTVQT